MNTSSIVRFDPDLEDPALTIRGPAAQPFRRLARRTEVTLTSGQRNGLDPGPWPPDDPEAAITALFDGHYSRMLRVAAVLLSDVTAAEDVVQDAFLAVFTSWQRVRDKQEAVGYLHRSVVNGARSRLRRRAVAARFRPVRESDAISAEDAALSGLVSGPLLTAMRKLPRREREAVLFRHYLDLSERQTAQALGLRPGSVKGYASRGLATLRATLNNSLDGQEQSS
jgi:RNA polymerase sigma-70 factor (sigma-E family)